MTWKGNDPAIEFRTIEDVATYIRSLNYSWRPSNFVIHNTASPTLYQWWHSVPPAQRMKNLQSYYENDMGWSAGPHFFIDGKSWWCMTPPNVKGVHSPSWNGTMLGFECVGNYATESDETSNLPAYPGGADVMKMAHALSATCCEFFGWDPSNLKFHKEDPATTHDCPGRNMVKSEFIADVQEYMGHGGGDTDVPAGPRVGVVANLSSGDTLNIRSSSSSSAPIIGTADLDDAVTVVGEAYNGSTLWYRLQFGEAAGTGIAVFGWASAAYIKVAPPPPPPYGLTPADIAAICNIANSSTIRNYSWRDRGIAPIGYTQGMACAFAQSYRKLQKDHAAVLIMARARTNSDKDALNIYRSDFDALGMPNESAGPDTLRHLYALMLGSGMRESSGRYCEGRDQSASNVSSDTAEAGLFQTSWNAHTASDPEFSNLMTEYSNPANQATCYVTTFDDGVSCTSSEWQNYGSGDGAKFQGLCKSCPAFAAETHGLTLRKLANHYGPIIRKECELKKDADTMFKVVEDYIDYTYPPESVA